MAATHQVFYISYIARIDRPGGANVFETNFDKSIKVDTISMEEILFLLK